MKKVAIGGGQGFWGDSPDAAIHMIRNADIQYMGCDYLAELTLSIMAKQQLKDPTKGFAPDFTTRILKEAGKEAWDKHIRICTNAGGMNINGCVDGIRQWAEGNSMHRLARADFPNRKQIVHEILHPEDRPAPQSSYSHYSGINYSALEVAVRRIQQDFDFLMRYLPKLPDDSYAKTETLKILKQHKAYMAQFEEILNDEKIA